MKHSVYQLAIFDFIENDTGSGIVQAVAGAGKTTTIVEASKRIPKGKSALFIAFNRSIVGELKERLPSHIHCKTYNGCGWGAWMRHTGKRYGQIKLDSKKTWTIIKKRFPEKDIKVYGSFVNRMVGLAKSMGLNSRSSIEEWQNLRDYHNIDLPQGDIDRAYVLCEKTLAASVKMAGQVCDFDDQIYMPWLLQASMTKYDFVFIDEAQDTNKIQCDLVKRMLKPGGRVVALGDKFQSVYGFRGSDSSAMDNIQKAFDAKSLPLSITYRCAKAIVRHAQKYVPSIEYADFSPEGKVENKGSYSIADFSGEDAILCRKNAPLVNIAYQFIARGQGVNFLGRDLCGGLIKIVNDRKAEDQVDLSVKLNDWLERESEKLRKKDREEQIEVLEDRVNCIEIISSGCAGNGISALINDIKKLFAGGRGVTLSSVHKAKGSEWEKVFILDPHYMPSKFAKKDWQKQQEDNIIYVAITRAKRELYYINTNCWDD